MKRDADVQRLKRIINQIVETKETRRGISPQWVATEAMGMLDRRNVTQRTLPLVYKAAHLELRQLAREACREKWDDPDSAEGEDRHPLFPLLQRRYPIIRKKGDEPTYVLLENLTDADIAFNVARLRSVSVACDKHADALERWGRSRPKVA